MDIELLSIKWSKISKWQPKTFWANRFGNQFLGTPWKICAMTEICFGQPHKNLVIRSMVGIEPLSIKQMNFLGSTPNVFGWWPNLFLCDNYKLVIEIFWSPSLVREKLGNWKNLVLEPVKRKYFSRQKNRSTSILTNETDMFKQTLTWWWTQIGHATLFLITTFGVTWKSWEFLKKDLGLI